MSDWPSSLPGLDLSKALSQLGGKKKLFVRLLGMFADAHTGDVDKLTQAYNDQDWTSLYEINHALKGVTGNLAAVDLYGLCSQMDHKLKDEDHNLEAEIEAMSSAMKTLLESMAQAKELSVD